MGRRPGWMVTLTGRPAMRSPGRPPVRRDVEREFWVKIAEGLSSEEAAIACGVSGPVGARWFRERGGMPSIQLTPPSGRYLSFAEREDLALLKGQGHGVRAIAHTLSRSPSTISRELRRNAATRGGRLDYRGRSRSGRPSCRPAAPRRRSWHPRSGFVSTSRTGSLARSPGPTGSRFPARRCGSSVDVTVVERTDGGPHRGARSRSRTG